MIAAKLVFIAFLLLRAKQCFAQETNLEDLISSVFAPSTEPSKTNTNQPPVTGRPPTPTPTRPSTSIGSNVGETGNAGTTGCGQGYDCVAYYLCKDNAILTDGEGLIDIRIDDEVPKECPFLEACCAVGEKVTEPLITPAPTPEGCGFRNTDGIGFKITGDKDNETQYGEFPWMVAILKEEKALDQILNIYQCGGSLIHPSVVLTAAHCVHSKQAITLKVRAGEWDTQTKAELFPDQDRDVVEIVIHEHYYKGGLFNDIALLHLASPFNMAENVKPVCLPPPEMNFDHSRCFATGWGKDVFGQSGKYQVILKKIELPMVPNDKCQATLRTTRLGKYFELHPSFVCAGGEMGKDTCKGDGGSPLVCPIPGAINRFYQAGIVAWGIGCGDAIPGVYASVAKLRPWIDQQLAYKQIDKAHFTP